MLGCLQPPRVLRLPSNVRSSCHAAGLQACAGTALRSCFRMQAHTSTHCLAQLRACAKGWKWPCTELPSQAQARWPLALRAVRPPSSAWNTVLRDLSSGGPNSPRGGWGAEQHCGLSKPFPKPDDIPRLSGQSWGWVLSPPLTLAQDIWLSSLSHLVGSQRGSEGQWENVVPPFCRPQSSAWPPLL